MNWLYYINNKSKFASILTIIVILILGKNILDKNNVTKLGKTFNEVYTDRLMVESYILKLSNIYHKKTIELLKFKDSNETEKLKLKIHIQNEEIKNLLFDYEKTKLTDKESELIYTLKTNIENYTTKENNLMNILKNNVDFSDKISVLASAGNVILANLIQLSNIQIEEGKRLNENSKNIVSNSLILTYFELAIIVVIALIIQAMIFATKSIFDKNDDAHIWN